MRLVLVVSLLVSAQASTAHAAEPEIRTVRPSSGVPGTRVRIRGTHLDGVTRLLVGGVRVDFDRPNARSIQFALPAQGGPLILVTRRGMVRGPELHVSDEPTITELLPFPADPGHPLTIRGANFYPDRLNVFLGEQRLVPTSASESEIVVEIPSDARNGTLRIETPDAETSRELEVHPLFEATTVQRGTLYEGDSIEIRGAGLRDLRIEARQEGFEPRLLSPRVTQRGRRAVLPAPPVLASDDALATDRAYVELVAVGPRGRRRALSLWVTPTRDFDGETASATRECQDTRCIITIRAAGLPLRPVVVRAGRGRLRVVRSDRSEIEVEDPGELAELQIRAGRHRFRIETINGRCRCTE